MSSLQRCKRNSFTALCGASRGLLLLGAMLGMMVVQAAEAPRRAQQKPAPKPAPKSAALQSFVLDPAQSTLTFSFEQAGARAEGRFRDLHATLNCRSRQPEDCALAVDVVVNSIDTQDKDRDALLRGALLFDAQRFAAARFVSSRITASNVTGMLTIRDRSRPQVIPLNLRFATAGGRDVAWLTGEFALNRLDFGVGQGEWASTESVANAVTVKFSLRLPAR